MKRFTKIKKARRGFRIIVFSTNFTVSHCEESNATKQSFNYKRLEDHIDSLARTCYLGIVLQVKKLKEKNHFLLRLKRLFKALRVKPSKRAAMV